jgi:hypothetical protein
MFHSLSAAVLPSVRSNCKYAKMMLNIRVICPHTNFAIRNSITPWRHIGGAEIQLHAFFTLALDGCEWSASPLEKEPLEPTG